MGSNGQDSRVQPSDIVTSRAQRKTIRRRQPRTRGLMGLSVAVAVLCSLPMAEALTCTYQVEEGGKCVDPKCPKDPEETQFIWKKDGKCELCPKQKTSSKDRKTCVDPSCDAKADEFIWTRTGLCQRCPGLKTADKDHRECVEPKCDSKYFYWSIEGQCEACQEYKVQDVNNKGECILLKCKANEKIEKDGKELKCTPCPTGRIAGGDNQEKCIVEFDQAKFRKADTVKPNAKKVMLDQQEFNAYQKDVNKYTSAADSIDTFTRMDTNDDDFVTMREVKADRLTQSQFKIGDIDKTDKVLEKKELIAKPESQNAILEAAYDAKKKEFQDKGYGFVNTEKSIDGKTKDESINYRENNQANQLVLEFQQMDSKDVNGPPDKKLNAKELNDKFPRWQVDEMIKEHDKNGDKMLDILEYADHHLGDGAASANICTEKELMEVDNGSKDINTCSTKGSNCYAIEKDKDGKAIYPAKNDKCKNKHESCADMQVMAPPLNGKPGDPLTSQQYIVCIRSAYCDKTAADGWNYKTWKLDTKKNTKINCPDGIKPDKALEEEKKKAKVRQDNKEKFAKNNGLEFAKKGNTCKNPGKDLGIFTNPRKCMEAALKEDNCNFFTYAQEWPKWGCHCCAELEPKENSDWDVYNTCVDEEEKPPHDDGDYSKCFNDKQLKAHNIYRKDHGANPLKMSIPLARKAQAFAKIQKDSVYKASRKDLQWKDNDGKFCGQNVFELESDKGKKDENKDVASLKGTDYVTKQWYKMNDNYDFDKHTFKSGKEGTQWQEFTQVVWKGSTEVGFGIHGKYVVAQYCSEGNYPLTPATFGMNVCNTKAKGGCKKCTDGDIANLGYSNCFNERAVNAHNIYRETHKKTPGLKVDPEIAAAAQKIAENLNKNGLAGTPENERRFDGFKIVKTGGKVCAENQYEGADEATAKDSDAATDFWYNKKKWYNFKEGKAVAPSNDNDKPKKDADMFARLIWKSTTKVGFGQKGKYVVAWYCEEQGAIGDADAYKKNIHESCIQNNGVNKCYNDAALKANNKYRDAHGTPDLEWDEKAAEEAQKQLDKLNIDGKLTLKQLWDKMTLEGDFKNCGPNVYTQDDSVNLLKTDVAIDKWYEDKQYYNFDKGTFTDKKKMQGKRFTNMMWKSSKKVGFAIQGKFVVAWYCPKNNDDKEISYIKNVCKEGECAKCLKEDKNNNNGKWNTCYNEVALKETNKFRKEYKAKAVKTKATLAIGAQKHAEKLLKDGKQSASPQDDRKDCGETIYEHTESKDADMWDLNNKDLAMKSWVDNSQYYDFVTGNADPKDKQKESDMFTQVVWKATTEVGFGIAGKYVVAWYCKAGNVKDKYLENVADKCILDDHEKINECYNVRALTAHNNRRADHGTPKLEWNKKSAKEIQKQMEAASSLTVKTIKEFKREGPFSTCIYNVYEGDNASKVVKEDLASDEWYSYEDNYDYKTGAPKKDMDKEKSKAFTNMMWKGTKNVGFGIKGKFVVAWYCPAGHKKSQPKDFKKNVCKKDGCKLCLENKKGVKYGYNKCYNDMALKYVNLFRGNHDADKVVLGTDQAKEAQKWAEGLSDGSKTGSSPTGGSEPRKKCWENIYKLADNGDTFDLESTDMALKEWTDQENDYDFSANKPKAGKKKADTDKFTSIVWKASKGKNVGFGIQGKYVVGWFCDEPNTSGSSDYQDNVSENCNKDNYNSCYNKKATAAHNKNRKAHGTDILSMDAVIAKEAQKQLVDLGDKISVDEIKKLKYEPGGKKCSQNIYTQDDEADLLQSDVASDKWYEGQSSYDYDNGKPTDDTDATKEKAFNAAKLLWKASKSVGFGIQGKFVMAYYCADGWTPGDKFDDTKSFKLNVCKKGECKLCTQKEDGTLYELNKCFNKLGIKEHNIYRLDHQSPKFVKYHDATAEAAQKKAEAAAAAGSLTATDPNSAPLFKGEKCKENMYKFDSNSPTEQELWDVLNTNIAFKNWYDNESKYDYTKHQSKTNTAEDNKLIKQFTQMIWKYDGTKIEDVKVGFGISGAYVYAYYCEGGNVDGKYPKNIQENCLKEKYNKCYNDRAVKAHNTKRKLHIMENYDTKFKMTVDTKAAKEIQKIMDKMIADKKPMTEKTLYDIKLEGDFKDCNANVHEHTDAVEQLDGDYATNGWYANKASYDYVTTKPIDDKAPTKIKADTYTQLLWKTSTKVGFGIKDKFVVAWYCDKKGNDPRDAKTFSAHVCKVDGCAPDGWKRYTFEDNFSMSDADKKDKTIKNVDCGWDKWCPFKGGDKTTKARHCGTHIDTTAKTITEKCVDYDQCETESGNVKIACLWRQCDPFTYRSKFADQYMCKYDKCAIADGKFVNKGDLGGRKVYEDKGTTFKSDECADQGRCGQCKAYEISQDQAEIYKYIAEDFKKDGITPKDKDDFNPKLAKDYVKKSYGKASLQPCKRCPIYQKRNAKGECEAMTCKDGEINVRDGDKQGECMKTDCADVESAKQYEDLNRGMYGSGYRGFQTTTISGNKCLAWTHDKADINAKTHPKAGLEENYCRNPDGKKQIWCYIETDSFQNGKIVKGITKEDCKPRTDKYDYCYNVAQIKAHNKYRADHKSKDLIFNIQSAIGAQKYLDGLGKDVTTPPASKEADRPKELKDCGENIFKLPSGSKKVTAKSDVATDTWYETHKYYEFPEYKPKCDNNKQNDEDVKQFMQLVWKASKNVGFGIRGDWVVAWYCPTGNTKADKANELNVCPKGGCIEDCVDPVPLKDGYSSCFNRRMERDINVYRKESKVAQVKFDVEMAKRAQKYAVELVGGSSKAANDECGYIFYYPSRNSDSFKTFGKDDQITKQWFRQSKDYDFDLNKHKAGKSYDDTKKFEQMMWAKSTKVGVGFFVDGKNDGAAVALFCDKKKDQKENACNICPKGGCTDSKCTQAKANKCEKKPDAPPPKAPVDPKVNTCESPNGNKVTISWNYDQKRVQFNAEVKKDQWFTVALGTDFDNTNQVVFKAKGRQSDAFDAEGRGKGRGPLIDFQRQSLAGIKVTDSDKDVVKLRAFRKLKTDFKEDAVLKLNTLTDLAWAENTNDPDALDKRTSLGKCQMKLVVEKCPAGKEKDTSDPDRIVACSSTTKCYDYSNKKYVDSKCPKGERCAKWDIGNGKETDGCVRKEYCQKRGNDVLSNVLFDCGDDKCTEKKKNDSNDRSRQMDCSSVRKCNKFSHSMCPVGERCGVFKTSVTTYSNCILKQYCGTRGDYRSQGVDFDCPDRCPDYQYWSYDRQRCISDSCTAYQKLLKSGKCESCGSQKATRDGKGCEAALVCDRDWERKQTRSNGEEYCGPDTCRKDQRLLRDGTCKYCALDEEVTQDGRGCRKKEIKCKSYEKRNQDGSCTACAIGETVSQDGTRCEGKCRDYTYRTSNGQCIADQCGKYSRLLISGRCDNCPTGQKATYDGRSCEPDIVCPDYKRDNGRGVCVQDPCGKTSRLDLQGRCVLCDAGDEAAPDGKSCVPATPTCPEYTRLQTSGTGTNRCRADACNYRQKLMFDGTCEYCGLYSRVSTDGRSCAKDVCVLSRQIYSKDGTCITCPQYTKPRADNYVCIKSHQYIKNQGQGPIRVGNNNGILSILGNAVTLAGASVLAAAMVLVSSL